MSKSWQVFTLLYCQTADGQISYSVIVAEEQSREVNGQISEEGFTSASTASAAIEAAANQTLKRENGDKRIHPMFRRRSGSASTSTTMDDEKPRKRRKVEGKIKEEPIELVDSDDDLDRVEVVDTKPAKAEKKEDSPDSLDGGDLPEAQGSAERYVDMLASLRESHG
jgi:hypothetical protein